jgi:glyoxylase-like metal-dependent hydrolase (beta-lactamase superfamily II)
MLTIQVIPGVYQVTIRYANMFLILEDKMTLIDTGFRGSTSNLVSFIHKIGRSPEEIGLIILTHNHLDHSGGLEDLRKLTKAKVAAPRADFIINGDTIPYPAGNYLGKLLKVPALSPIKHRLVLQAKDIEILLDGNEVLPVFGGLQVIATPGHTMGSISLYAPQHKMLFVGDALNKHQEILRMPLRTVSTNLQEARASIRRMAELDVEILCTGHGRPMMQNAKANLQALAARLKL